MLHNSVPFRKKFANNDKSNVFVSGNVNNHEEINIHWNDSFQSIFWSWNNFKPTFFHPASTFLDIKICDLTWTNIEI